MTTDQPPAPKALRAGLESLRSNLRRRPWWMNATMAFCAYMAVFYLPFDLFLKPVAQDQEVWFGYVFEGWWAKATAPLHWLVYGAGAYGLWTMHRWIHPWAAVYIAQVALSMFVWHVTDDRGMGLAAGIVNAVPFLGLAGLFIYRRSLFVPPE